jgi:protocatechuate 3,4-dioxygenase beta subunit
MKSTRWVLIAVVLAAVAGVAFFALRSGEPKSPVVDPSAAEGDKATQTRTKTRSRATTWEPYSPLIDAPDPTGTLRLEGQVVDSQSHGVDKATVTLNSSPPKTAITEADGSFVFKNLIARQYKLRARAGALVGGPIKHRVTAKSEPVIIRMRPGVALEVLVISSEDQRPIAGAVVAVDRQQQQTSGAGKARFEGIAAGYVVLAARAKGYGVAQRLFEVPAGNKRVTAKIVLSRGASVTGLVNDDKGQPVAGAKVRAYDMAQLVPLGASPLSFVETDAGGKFTITGVARGTYRFGAHKTGLPPAQSAPIAVDGKTDRAGVVITFAVGATLAGRVVGKDGSPAASATVKVRVVSGGFGGAASYRRTVTDQRGAFALRGLPRRKVEALAYSEASSEEASSEAKRFDLSKGDVKDATFQLTVDGKIAGTVVDGAGQPVAEARVTAIGDFWGGAKIADLRLRGSAQVMTDGGGNFRFGGLPAGKYRLRASRTMRQATRSGPGGVAAKTGDTAVKIVLRKNGGARGVLRFKDGTPATLYTVSVGYPPTVPVAASDGAFQLANLRPGKYDVTFNSATFTRKIVRNVAITPGQVTNLGTITVSAGRSIKGRVVDAKGQPVQNAAVVLGSRIVGNGANLALELGASVDQSMGLRRAASQPDGTFLFRAVGASSYVVAAEHAEHGRSTIATIPAGAEDGSAELRLRPFGSVNGLVKLGSAVAPSVTMIVSAGSSKQVAVVRSGSDGRYVFERLPAGKCVLTAMAGRGASASTATKQIVVEAGKSVRADIVIDVGEIDLSVTVVAKTGTIDATQVFLFSGNVSVSSGAQINAVFLAASKKGGAKMAFAAGGKSATFAKIRAGAYSICSIPITGNMNDPLFAKRLQAHAAKLKVHCQPHTVAPSPSKQSLTLTLPPMVPLPKP